MRRGAWLMAAPALALVALFLVWPGIDAVVTSFHHDTPFAPRQFIGFENYVELAGDDAARATIGFTLMFVAITVVLEVAVGLVVALVLDASFRGRGLVRAAALVPWAVPTVVAAVVWKHVFNDQYGGVNLLLYGSDLGSYRAWLAEPATARLAVIVADVWKTSGFAALILLAGLQSIPSELHEAARVDGAGTWDRFLHITLPLLRPAILLAALFRTIDAFRVFDLVYVMTAGGPGDATNVLSLFGYHKLFPEQRFGYGSAVSVVVFLVVAGFSALLVRLGGPKEEA